MPVGPEVTVDGDFDMVETSDIGYGMGSRRRLPAPMGNPKSSFDDEVRRLLLRQAAETLHRMVDELVDEKGRQNPVRVLATIESFAAAQRGVMADLDEPPMGQARRRGLMGDGFAMGVPPGTGGSPEDFLGKMADALPAILEAQLRSSTDGAIEHKLGQLVSTAARLEKMEDGHAKEQLQRMLDVRMAELHRKVDEAAQEALPAPPAGVGSGVTLEVVRQPGAEEPDPVGDFDGWGRSPASPATTPASIGPEDFGGDDLAPPHDCFSDFPPSPGNAPVEPPF